MVRGGCFVDIGGMVDHHCLNFHKHISQREYLWLSGSGHRPLTTRLTPLTWGFPNDNQPQLLQYPDINPMQGGITHCDCHLCLPL